MGIGWSIGFASCSYLFIIIFCLISRKNFAYRTKEKFDFHNVFPYEFNITERFLDNLLGNIFLIAFSIASVFFFATFSANYTGYSVFTLIAGIIATLAEVFIFFIPLGNNKAHIAIFSFLGSFGFILPFSIFLNSISIIQKQGNLYYLIPTILAGLISLISICVLVNPKLKFNITMMETEDGYKRKPLYVAAVSEWILILMIEITKISTIIMVLLA